MKLFLVHVDGYHDTDIEGVFSTKEKALSYARSRYGPSNCPTPAQLEAFIEEAELDVPLGETVVA